MEDIIIPMLETSHRQEDSTSSSSLITESSEGCQVLVKIDFSQFPEDIRDSTEEDLQDMSKQLNEKLIKIQNEIENVNPNLKVYN